MNLNLAQDIATKISAEYHAAKQSGDNRPNLFNIIQIRIIGENGIHGSDEVIEYKKTISRIMGQRRGVRR